MMNLLPTSWENKQNVSRIIPVSMQSASIDGHYNCLQAYTKREMEHDTEENPWNKGILFFNLTIEFLFDQNDMRIDEDSVIAEEVGQQIAKHYG